MLYLIAEGIERQDRPQYLTQTWKSSILSEEDYEPYTLPDLEVPLVYQLVPKIGAHLYEIAPRVMRENKMNLTHGGVY